MIGWKQDITYGVKRFTTYGTVRVLLGVSRCHPALGFYDKPKNIIGIVVAAKFPEPELIREKLEEGIARVSPDSVWVMRSPRKRGDAISVAWDVLEEHGIEPILAPSNTAYFKTGAGTWRDGELLQNCERVIVFHDISSHVTEGFIERPYGSPAKVYTIERGTKKSPKRRSGRKPVGA